MTDSQICLHDRGVRSHFLGRALRDLLAEVEDVNAIGDRHHEVHVVLDEPSLGLAPTVVAELFRIVALLNKQEKLTVLVVEQNAQIALEVSDRAYVLEVGRVAVEGTSDELKAHEGVRKSYLGY